MKAYFWNSEERFSFRSRADDFVMPSRFRPCAIRAKAGASEQPSTGAYGVDQRHACDHPRIQKSANQHASRPVRTRVRADQFLCPKFEARGTPSCLLIDDAMPGVREGMCRDASGLEDPF